MLRGAANCNENARCRSHDPCPRCLCLRVLDRDDWQLIDFYRSVSDQVIETGKDFMPRLEGYRAGLEIGGHARRDWPWLCEGARTIHGFMYRTNEVNWYRELGKPLRDVTPEDVTDGATL